MEIGIKGEQKLVVTADKLACNVGSGLVAVFATPMMIAAIENTAAGSVAPYLEEGKTTVGTLPRPRGWKCASRPSWWKSRQTARC